MERTETCKVIGDKRIRPELKAKEERVGTFAEAEPTFSLKEAVAEAKRCTVSNPCLYCEVCELMCPDLCIIRDDKSGNILIDLDFCKGCGLCAIYCPHDAIKMVIDEQS
jgi:Pyruvate/2-oxoacid:ferredoxin oxidoreductase delta subunit